MKHVFPGTIILLAMAFLCPDQARARLNIGINFSLPPAIIFAEPPQMVVIPETYVYVAPYLNVDIFFHQGWWWRPWEGRWYRSQHYNSGWRRYRDVPSFYRSVPSGWRHEFKEKRWQGHDWRYQKVHPQDVRRNWRGWEKGRHWEQQNNWGVKGLQRPQQSRPPSGREQRWQDQPQKREAPQRSNDQQGRDGREKDRRQDRGQDRRDDRR